MHACTMKVLVSYLHDDPVLIETDCLEVVKMLKQDGVDRSAYSPIVEEIKTLLKVH
jgi:hypothetical protein